MVSRRNFLGGVSAASMACFVKDALPATFHSLLSASSGNGTDADNTKFVKIAIGTGGHGHTYPGATMPFGAVQLSPDTGIKTGITVPDITTPIARFSASATPT